MKIDYSTEADGRWIAEVEEVPGAMAYGVDGTAAKALALNIAADVLLRERDEARETAYAARRIADKHAATIVELRAMVERLTADADEMHKAIWGALAEGQRPSVIAARDLLERTEP